MICEKCAGEVKTLPCKNCGEDIVKLGPYCYACGSKFEREMKEPEDSDDDFENRILCSDGACIGLVENGVCKVCGKPYTAET